MLICRHIGSQLAACGKISFRQVSKAGGMLKVTIKQVDSAETWELEGKISGVWVKELERCWKERLTPPGIPLQVHLKTVSYIDAAGKQLLVEMHGSGGGIRGGG